LFRRSLILSSAFTLVLATGCGTSDNSTSKAATSTTAAETTTSTTKTASDGGLDVSAFKDGALASEPTTEDCTLSGGTKTTCYRITVTGYPTDHEVGPFCPTKITDTADKAGIWLDGKAEYDLDGNFIKNLSTLYGDEKWHMYDADGNVLVTDTKEAFEGAARPDVDPAYQNHCVEGRVEWLADGKPIQSTMLMPTKPVAAETSSTPNSNLGVTLDGVVIAQAAPVSAILGAYTIAAFDDCGGHFNAHEGYHLHAATGCSEAGSATDGDTPIFGYALDGYPVHSPLADDQVEAAKLDECGGHTTAEGYHYHANKGAKNLVISCFVGQTAPVENAGGPPAGGPPAGAPPAGAPATGPTG
jgi:hypothetical protein